MISVLGSTDLKFALLSSNLVPFFMGMYLLICRFCGGSVVGLCGTLLHNIRAISLFLGYLYLFHSNYDFCQWFSHIPMYYA